MGFNTAYKNHLKKAKLYSRINLICLGVSLATVFGPPLTEKVMKVKMSQKVHDIVETARIATLGFMAGICVASIAENKIED